MTHTQRLENLRKQMECGLVLESADYEWLCDLALDALSAQRPAGSVKVRIAVATNGTMDGMFMCACKDGDEGGALRAMVRDCEECKRVATNAAIIEAWIPLVAVPVVEGVTVEYSPHREQSTKVEP